MSNFRPLEVVSRGSEIQLRVGENINKITSGKKLNGIKFEVMLLKYF